MLVLRLQWCGRGMLLTRRRYLLGGRLRSRAAGSAVEAYIRHRRAVDHCLIVDVCNIDATEIVDGLIVVEDAVLPITTLVADASIAEAVVDAAIETDVRTPIAGMQHVDAIAPPPIGRRPQQADSGWQHPCARHPVITLRTICPEAGRPDVADVRHRRLIVDGEQGRGDLNRDTDCNLR